MKSASKAPVPNVKHIIAVASGKGGVGKSTVAVNLALALSAQGKTVGLLDADIYGPSQPTMLGVHKRPEVKGGRLQPVISHGIQTMSMGLLVASDNAMIWRGPMVSKGLQQMLYQTDWQAVDYLIIDLPPGTGDVQLTMAQKIPVTGAVVVTTPQDIALIDVKRAVAMFKQVDVPVQGIVENMSVHVCTECGHQDTVFGSQGGEKIAAEFGLPLLAKLPLNAAVCEQSESGVPTVVAAPESEFAKIFKGIAEQVASLRGSP